MNQSFDILFLIDDGIGNALEMLYAVEYCIKNGKKTGLFLGKASRSFASYLRDSYGQDVILDDIEGIAAVNVVHSWLYTGTIPTKVGHYFYVNPTYQNTLILSETEQYISIAKSLYPSDINSECLTLLKEDYSERLKALAVENKIVIYPGCNSKVPTKRWPYFLELIKRLGERNVIVIGGTDDLNYAYSYYYPMWIIATFPALLLRKIYVYNFLKRVCLLNKHSHLNGIEKRSCSYFNVFSWAELTALLRRAKFFVGNDGGLAHLAGACGAAGLIIFGPTSINKNRPYNSRLRPISKAFDCQPCQFGVNKKDSMAKNSILCPYQIRCLYSIGATTIASAVPVGGTSKP